MKKKEIIDRLKKIEDMLNATDEEFAKRYDSKNDKFLAYARIGAVKGMIEMLKEDIKNPVEIYL